MARPIYPSDKADKTLVRFPEGMGDKLRELAKKNKRSLNAEIIDRLEATLNHSVVRLSDDAISRIDFRAMFTEKTREQVIAEIIMMYLFDRDDELNIKDADSKTSDLISDLEFELSDLEAQSKKTKTAYKRVIQSLVDRINKDAN